MRAEAEVGGVLRVVVRVTAGIEEVGMNTTTSAFELAHNSHFFSIVKIGQLRMVYCPKLVKTGKRDGG